MAYEAFTGEEYIDTDLVAKLNQDYDACGKLASKNTWSADNDFTAGLTVNKTPTVNTDVSNKKYVDDSIANGDVNSAKYLNITNFIPSNSDFNDYKTPGEYQVQSNTEANTIANLPTSYNDATPRGGVLSVLIGFNAPRTSLVQIYRTYGSSYVVSRTYQRCFYHENSSWTAWREIACTDEVGLLNQANTFTALNTFRANIAVSSGTTAGSQGQIILGNKPQSATVQANIIASTTGALNYIATESTGHYFKIGNNTASTSITTNESETAIFSHNAFEFARITNVGVAKWLGNANTATKLQTARTINGVSFDGTANITIADSTKLPIAGGTMTGDLTLKGNPTADLMAATKKYVDDSIANGDVNSAKYLNITNFIPSNSDFNDYKTPGEYQVQSNTEANTIANLPTSYNDATPRGGVLSVLIGFNAPRTSLVQIYRTYGSSYVVSRTYQRCFYHENSSWTAWREIACTDEVGLLNQANTFTALNTFRANIAVSSGTTAGSQGQIILGNKPQSATVQANIIASTTGALNYIATESTGHYFKIGNNTASTSITTNESETAIFSHNAFEFARITNVGVAKWLGNANTATKLQTARTINGVSFDGTANITIADSTKLPIAGGTMTGDLTLKGNPTADLMAATKKYVDDSVASAGGGDVLAAGDNSFTGANTFQNLVTMVGGAVFTSRTTTLAWKNATQTVATINASTYTGNSATATKLATARTIKANLASSTAGSFDGSANITVGVTGTLPIANGGTGLTSAPSMLVNLASTTATSPLQASPRPGVTGTLPIANGGTGQTTAAGVRNALGLGNTTGAVPIANGGTGATTAAAARTALGCAPAYTYSTTDLTAGSSKLTTGTLYIVYE